MADNTLLCFVRSVDAHAEERRAVIVEQASLGKCCFDGRCASGVRSRKETQHDIAAADGGQCEFRAGACPPGEPRSRIAWKEVLVLRHSNEPDCRGAQY